MDTEFCVSERFEEEKEAFLKPSPPMSLTMAASVPKDYRLSIGPVCVTKVCFILIQKSLDMYQSTAHVIYMYSKC